MASANVHIIFVKSKEKDTLTILQYIKANLPILQQMGIEVKIEKVTDGTMLSRHGVTRFPALKLPSQEKQLYFGVPAITELYGKNIAKFQQFIRQQGGPPRQQTGPPPRQGGGTPSQQGGGTLSENRYEEEGNSDPEGGNSDLDDYYKKSMRDTGEDNDFGEEEDIGESQKSIMANYQSMMIQRSGSKQKIGSGPRGSSGGAAAQRQQPRQAPPQQRQPPSPQRQVPQQPAQAPPPQQREDNIELQDDEEDPTFIGLMSNLGKDTPGVPKKVLTGGPIDDEEGPNPQDDLMEAAYYANMIETRT